MASLNGWATFIPPRLGSPHERPVGGCPPCNFPSEDDLRGACQDLLRSWDATYIGVEEISLGRADQEADPIRFLLVLAFASHAHHLTGTACSMLDGDDYPSAVPLLRVAYESALTAA